MVVDEFDSSRRRYRALSNPHKDPAAGNDSLSFVVLIIHESIAVAVMLVILGADGH